MASVLIVSMSGSGIPIAIRLAQDGHIVKMWIKEETAKPSLTGFRNPSKVSDPYKMIDQYDLILSDMVGTGSICENLSQKGKLVLGGGLFNDKIELNRDYGSKVASSLTEAKLPKTVSIKTYDDLVKHIESAKTPQAIKPLDNQSSKMTLVSHDPKNRMLRSRIKVQGKELVPCIAQETIEGIAISTEGWFNGKTWVKPFNHTIEQKRLMEGDKGCQTGCMGNVVWPTSSNKLTKTVLEPLSELLIKVNYVGPIDVNCIVTEDSAYFLEFSSRFGYDAIQAWSELIKPNLFDYFYGIASQQKESFTYHDERAMGVRISMHPYPARDNVKSLKGLQVIDPPKEALKHVWYTDVMEKDGVKCLAGVDGVVGVVTSRGIDVRECKRRVQRTIRNITLTDELQYRNDIGDNVERDIQTLVEQGWLNA